MRVLPFILLGIAFALPAEAAALRGTEVHVASDVVTLSDLFSETGDAAAAEVAKAPPQGKSILLDSGTLYGIAIANHIDWKPRGMGDKVIVIRDITDPASPAAAKGPAAVRAAIDLPTILAPLKPALADKGAGDRLDITLDDGQQMRLLASIAKGTPLAVDEMTFDTAKRKFIATLVNAATGERYAVAGRAIQLVEVPVPVRAIGENEIINASDLTTIEQRADQLRSDTATLSTDLVGKMAKQPLQANLPVQERFLGMPVVIKRDDRVTMIVRNGSMMLTAEGRAMNDAGIGETVHLINAASNKPVEGIVTGAGTAEVRTETAIVADATAHMITR
jgi:flagella basal body P-ring formation protein FlgA